jgi:hypothetical protein
MYPPEADSTMRLYSYVGPRQIAERVGPSPSGTLVESPGDVLRWARATGQKANDNVAFIVTFVVDEAGSLRIADRRSEHVACAGGHPVWSAGEMTFVSDMEAVEVVAVSNQSTGYCPEPESWPEVEAALQRANLPPPKGFSPACVFRRCVRCQAINLVKGGVFECAVCDGELPKEYNCQNEGGRS